MRKTTFEADSFETEIESLDDKIEIRTFNSRQFKRQFYFIVKDIDKTEHEGSFMVCLRVKTKMECG